MLKWTAVLKTVLPGTVKSGILYDLISFSVCFFCKRLSLDNYETELKQIMGQDIQVLFKDHQAKLNRHLDRQVEMVSNF